MGRVIIEISSSEPEGVQVIVARACRDPHIIQLVAQMLDPIIRSQPAVIVQEVDLEAPLDVTKRKRGGPVGMPEAKRLEIIAGWFKVQGRVKEVVYANSQGISPSTLRRWIHEFRQAGKL